MKTIEDAPTDIGLFAQLLENCKGKMTPALARHVLALGFSKDQQKRMTDLAERNQEDKLTSREREELFAYARAGDLLALLQSKARRALSGRRSPAKKIP